MQNLRIIILATWLLFAGQIKAQFEDRRTMDDRTMERDTRSFYAETKQVSQFIRRFNGEENVMGKRLPYLDTAYRDAGLRRIFIPALFGSANSDIAPSLKRAFINDVTNTEDPKFLDFHGKDWFGEAYVKFARGNTEVFITLFMELVKENLGSKWVIADIYYPPYEDLYVRDEDSPTRFLHPMSHELDFMNIHKAFDYPKYIEYYAHKDYHPDYLTLLFYEIKKGEMKFVNSGSLKFHFFQIDGWYFEVSFVNRSGKNSGWLITKLYKISDTEKEELIKFYLP